MSLIGGYYSRTHLVRCNFSHEKMWSWILFLFDILQWVPINSYEVLLTIWTMKVIFIAMNTSWSMAKNRVFSLLAQLVEHCTYIAEVMGSNPVWAWSFFSGLIFTTAWVVLTTAKIAFIFTSLSAVQMIFAYSQSEKETAWNYWMYENF